MADSDRPLVDIVAEDIATWLRVYTFDTAWTAKAPAVRLLAAKVIRDVDPSLSDGYVDGVEPPVGPDTDSTRESA